MNTPLRKRIFIATLFAVLTGLMLVWLSRDSVLQELQKAKYGDSATLCFAEIEVAFDDRWVISLIALNNRSPLLFGLFPIPRAWTELTDKGQFMSLRAKNGSASVSIHKTELTIKPDEIRDNCLRNSACSITKSPFESNADVARVLVGSSAWLTYLDQPLMVAVHGAFPDETDGLRVASCRPKQK